jgi:hypothetical protein
MTQPINKIVVNLDGGKYSVIHREQGGAVTFEARRNGEPWRDLTGDGLVLSMLHEIDSFKPRSIDSNFRVVGTNHREEFPKAVERGLVRTGAALHLVPDPDNAYDKNAVKVMLGEDWIGFVEREACARILMMMRLGMPHEASITQYEPGLPQYDQLRSSVKFSFYVKSA